MPFGKITLNPAIDFAAKRYTFVTVNAAGNGIACPAAAKAVGVIQEPNNINEPAQVMVAGVSFIVLGGVVPTGSDVSVGEDGKAIVTVAPAAVVGKCLAGGILDDIGSILLI